MVAPSVVVPDGAGDCASKFRDEVNETRNTLTERFGADLRVESLPPEIAPEVTWLAAKRGQLVESGAKIEARRSSIRNDLAALAAAFASATEKLKKIEGELTQATQEEASVQAELADVLKRGAAHNAQNRQFRLPYEQAQLDAYDQKTAELEAEAQNVTTRLKQSSQRAAYLRKEKSDLDGAAIGLATRQNVLDKARQVLEDDESAFLGDCRRSVLRARALAQVAAVAVPAESKTKPDPAAAVLKSVATDLTVQAFKRLVYATEAPGIAIAVADVTHAAMDERTRQVANNILLVGDYGLALKRLNDQGRLRPGDLSYEALRHMLSEIQGRMPSSSAEFTLQSLASVRTLTEGLAAAAGHYAQHHVQQVGAAVMKHLSVKEKQVLGRAGYQFFKHTLSATVATGTLTTVEALLKESGEEIREHLEESRMRRLGK